jgi:DNA polymerase III alpha subunit (gram-positive type)
MTKLSELNLAIVDLETSGLDENIHEILEIGVLVYDPRQEKIIDEYETKVMPSHIHTAQTKALEMNGYANNPSLYTNSLNSALIKVNSLVKGCMIMNQNCEFDIKFLRKAMSDLGIEPSFDRHRKLDLMAMAWFAVKDTDIKGMSLEKLCDHFDISNVGAHGALTDCKRALGVYLSLVSYYGQTTLPISGRSLSPDDFWGAVKRMANVANNASSDRVK